MAGGGNRRAGGGGRAEWARHNVYSPETTESLSARAGPGPTEPLSTGRCEWW